MFSTDFLSINTRMEFLIGFGSLFDSSTFFFPPLALTIVIFLPLLLYFTSQFLSSCTLSRPLYIWYFRFHLSYLPASRGTLSYLTFLRPKWWSFFFSNLIRVWMVLIYSRALEVKAMLRIRNFYQFILAFLPSPTFSSVHSTSKHACLHNIHMRIETRWVWWSDLKVFDSQITLRLVCSFHEMRYLNRNRKNLWV